MQKREKLILCIIGLPGSGKSTVAEIVRKNFPACSFETGDAIRDEIRRRGLPYTKENDEKISRWFHDGRERLITVRIAGKIKSCGRRIAVISGLRAREELGLLAECGRIALVAVTVPAPVRYRRELARKRFGSQTKEYLRERDKRELNQGLRELLKEADFRIANDSGRRGLEKKTVALVGNILKQEPSALNKT